MECHNSKRETVWKGAGGTLHIGEPELYVDNQSRKRSGHMSHVMIEYAPGKILVFTSNCSAVRFGSHAAGEPFSEVGTPDLDSKGYAYGNLQFPPRRLARQYDASYPDTGMIPEQNR